MWRLDRSVRATGRSAIAAFDCPSAINASASRLRPVSSAIGAHRRERSMSRATIIGSRTLSPIDDPLQRIDDDVRNALLQEFAGPLRMRLEQPDAVARGAVPREHQHGERRLRNHCQTVNGVSVLDRLTDHAV